jgi:hypothetical protein
MMFAKANASIRAMKFIWNHLKKYFGALRLKSYAGFPSMEVAYWNRLSEDFFDLGI